MQKEHFKNLLGKFLKVQDKLIMKIIDKQPDTKLGQFTQEELNVVRRKIKNMKAACLDEIPPEVQKTRKFEDLLLRYCNAVYNQNTIEIWPNGCVIPFPKKSDLGIVKNYRGITQKYRRQGNLRTYCSDIATPYITRAQ